MKSILVHVMEDAELETRLQTALDLARSFDAHLTCISNIPYNAYLSLNPFGGAYLATAVFEAMQEQETNLSRRVENHLSKEDVRWSYVSATNFDDQEIIGQGALNDLIVMGHHVDQTGGTATTLIGRILTASHTPLLLVPQGQESFDVEGSALVAWNGSFESANALRAAVPFLKRAKKVTLFTIKDEHDDLLPSTAASEYLSRHGISSELVSKVDKETPIAETLLKSAKKLNATYLVMGAFGHSRAHEFWFGGVTRTMLNTASIPLLLSR